MPSNTFPGHGKTVDPATTQLDDTRNDGDAVSTISNGKIGALNEDSGTQMTLLNDALGDKQDNRSASARSNKSRTSRSSSSAMSRSSHSSKSGGSTRPASAAEQHMTLPGAISEEEKEEEKTKEEAKPEVKEDFSKAPLKKAEDMIIKPTGPASTENAENGDVTETNDKNKEITDRVGSAKSTKSKGSAKTPQETSIENEEPKSGPTEDGKPETVGPTPPTENREPEKGVSENEVIPPASQEEDQIGDAALSEVASSPVAPSEVASSPVAPAEVAPPPEAGTLEDKIEDTVKTAEENGTQQADTPVGEGR